MYIYRLIAKFAHLFIHNLYPMKHPLLLAVAFLAILITACQKFDFDRTTTYLTDEQRDSLRVSAANLRQEGRLMREKSMFSEALDLQSRALDLSTSLNDTLLIVQDLNQLGTTFRRLGRLENALNSHYSAVGYAEAYHEDTSATALKNLVMSYNGLGNVHLSLGNDRLAERYFRRALVGETKLQSTLGLAINYANLGSIFELRNELDSAMIYYRQSMEMNQKLDSQVGISLCHVHFGQVLEKQGELATAEEEFRSAINVIGDSDDAYHKFDAVSALSRNLYLQQRYKESEQLVDEAVRIATSIRSFENMQTAYNIKAELSEARGDYEGALRNLQASTQWRDSIVNTDEDKQIRDVCINYEIQSHRTQLEKLQQAYDANERMHNAIAWIEFALLLSAFIAIATMLYALDSRKKRIKALDRLDNMRNSFFRNLTHEFRTPLTVIMGLADQLKTEEVPVEQRNHLLSSINQQGKMLLNLVNELLSISKLMSGREKCEWRKGNIVDFIRMNMSSYTDFARVRNIDLRFNTTQEEIVMDFVPDYYQKIINNLLGNAFKHTPSGGSITVNLGTRSTHFTLDIIDTGEGISVEDLPHIFEMFYMGQGNAKVGNTGIGLPYVQQMVRQMGGIITAENNLPRGTTMHIVVARKCSDENVSEIRNWQLNDNYFEFAANTADTEEEVLTLEDTTLPLVMVVEDNPGIADYISLLLHSRYRVIKASDAYDALRQLGSQIPDVILTDLMMPGMDGYDLCHAIRQSPTMSDVPIIIISARAEDSDRVHGLENGADCYMVKPFNPTELLATINRLIELRKTQRNHLQQLINGEESQSQELGLLKNTVMQLLAEGSYQFDTLLSTMKTTRSELTRLAKQETHLSPMAYILQVRLCYACHLLKDTKLSISEIAMTCGFSDTNYFNRIFRQHHTLTPQQYRQKVTNA